MRQMNNQLKLHLGIFIVVLGLFVIGYFLYTAYSLGELDINEVTFALSRGAFPILGGLLLISQTKKQP